MRPIAACLLVLLPLPVFAQAPNPKANEAAPGWSVSVTESGSPRGQSAIDYATEVDREIRHGGQCSLSIRSIVPKPLSFRSVSQFIKADDYRGKRVRLTGYVKTRDVANWCGFYLRVDGMGTMLGFDNMQWRQVKGTTDWTRYETVLDVPEAALRLAFGPVISGAGQLWVDDLTLETVDPKNAAVTERKPAIAYAERASNLDFEAISDDTTNPVAAWKVYVDGTKPYSQRITEGGARGGRFSLEVKSMTQGTSAMFFAHQDITAGPYQGKRVRFRAYFKPEGVADEAYLSLESYGPQPDRNIATRRGQGLKGTSDWQSQEVVLDVPADADGLCLALNLMGTGTLGVDDASIEVVDPSKVPLTADSEVIRAEKEKRLQEMREALPRLPGQPQNLDFEH